MIGMQQLDSQWQLLALLAVKDSLLAYVVNQNLGRLLYRKFKSIFGNKSRVQTLANKVVVVFILNRYSPQRSTGHLDCLLLDLLGQKSGENILTDLPLWNRLVNQTSL